MNEAKLRRDLKITFKQGFFIMRYIFFQSSVIFADRIDKMILK